MNLNQVNVLSAFKKNQENLLRKIHLYLNGSYYNLIFKQEEEKELNETELCYFKNVENVWIEHEKSDCYNKYDCYKPIKNAIEVEKILQQHPVYNHAIFSYLHREATLDEIKYFITSDSILNLEFFDYLAYSVIGVSDEARLEIITNLWEKAGKGRIPLFHTVLYKRLMDDLDLIYDREKIIAMMSWEGLAVINLFNYLALYSSNKMKYFGLLAATEMLDPPHYHQLINGLSKVKIYKNNIDMSYFQEFEIFNDEHAEGWMNNVIIPILEKRPDKTSEFWLGFYLRLDSAQRYYDNLLNYFLSRKAA